VKIAITIGIAIVFLFVLGMLLDKCNEPPVVIPVNDTTYVQGDKIWLPSDTTVIYVWRSLPAITDTVWMEDSSSVITKSSDVDTMFVNNQDTIEVAVIVDYYPGWDVFDWYMEIEHKDYDFSRIDTLTIKEYIPVEIKVAAWEWVVATIVSTLALLLLLISGG